MNTIDIFALGLEFLLGIIHINLFFLFGILLFVGFFIILEYIILD
jgi:hypothetical protein